MTASDPGMTIRTDIRPGDLGTIVYQHGVLYAREHGFDETFEPYVAEPLARFVLDRDPVRSRLFIAEREGRFLGSIAMVDQGEGAAQLRWFLVMPESRGLGVGRRLIDTAMAFCREIGYTRVFLWTVDGLPAARHLYESVGFRLAEATPRRLWGRDLVEQRFEVTL